MKIILTAVMLLFVFVGCAKESTEQKEEIKQKTTQKEAKKIKAIDFNCDLAQSFGVYKNDAEFDLLDYVSSVNISAGFHAGDPIAIKNALLKAKEKNVVIGAHTHCLQGTEFYNGKPILYSLGNFWFDWQEDLADLNGLAQVKIDENEFMIKGVESYAIETISDGQKIGLLV